MNGRSHSPAAQSQQGVVLLESLIAVLIFSLGVLGIVGLQAAMIKNTSEAKYRAEASYLAQQRIGLMWADPATPPADIDTAVDVSARLPAGTRTVTQPVAGGPFVITVRWQQPGEPAHNFTTTASITGG